MVAQISRIDTLIFADVYLNSHLKELSFALG